MKNYFKRGLILFFVVGTYWVILQDKNVSDYFKKTGTIIEILVFTIAGALVYSWVAHKLSKRKKDRD